MSLKQRRPQREAIKRLLKELAIAAPGIAALAYLALADPGVGVLGL